MGVIRLIDVYTQKIKDTDFIVSVVYSEKAKAFCKIYKKLNKDLFENLEGLINEDVSCYIKPKIRANGTTALDLEL